MTEWSMYLNGPDALKAEVTRGISQIFDLKEKVLSLNREIASRNSEIANLNQRIKDFKKAGDYELTDKDQLISELLEDKYLGERLTNQRKEIAILHRIIKELKEQINAE